MGKRRQGQVDPKFDFHPAGLRGVVGFLFILNEFVTTAACLGEPHKLADLWQTGHAVDAEVAAEAVAEAAWRTTPWNSDAEFAALK